MALASLALPPVYAVQGAFRLARDPNMSAPMWHTVRPVARKALLIAAAWAMLTWPLQRLIVDKLMKRSARVLGMRGLYDAVVGSPAESPHHVVQLPSLTTFAAFIFILGQCQAIIEFLLRRQLRAFRVRAYHVTIEMSKHSSEWWIPYVEEWQDPPYERAYALFVAKKPFYRRWASGLFQRIVVRVLLFTLDCIPFLTMWVSAYLRSFGYSQQLLEPFFEHKKMTPQQVHLFLTERLWPLRLFAFTCACLERLPLLGTLFSISNRVGAALLVLDLEKRQHLFAAGELAKVPSLPPFEWSEPQYHYDHLIHLVSLGVTSTSTEPTAVPVPTTPEELQSPGTTVLDQALTTATDAQVQPNVSESLTQRPTAATEASLDDQHDAPLPALSEPAPEPPVSL